MDIFQTLSISDVDEYKLKELVSRFNLDDQLF